MENNRLTELLTNAIDYAKSISNEYANDLIKGMGISANELSEILHPVNWSNVPIDTKILVYSNGHVKKRYFAGYSCAQDEIRYFADGKTSYSNDCQTCRISVQCVRLQESKYDE